MPDATDRHIDELRPVSLVDQLIEKVRARVLLGTLAAGESVTEAYCVDSFGVSRVTAQKAISHMVARTLLTQEPNKAARIPQVTSDGVRDIFRVRIPIEVEALRVVVRSGRSAHVAKLRAVADQLKGFDGADLPRFSELDLEFHRSLIVASESPRLLRIWEAIQWELQLAMIQAARPIDAPLVACDHARIAEAIMAADYPRGKDELSSHLKAAREELAMKLPAEALS